MQIGLESVNSQIENLKRQQREIGRIYDMAASLSAAASLEQEPFVGIREGLRRELEALWRQKQVLGQMTDVLTAVCYYWRQAEEQICDRYMGNARYFINPPIGRVTLMQQRLPSPVRLGLRREE